MRTGDSTADVSGDVELVLQWRYNARLDFCPFDDFVDEHVGETPNELRIALIRAQGLAIADKNLLSKGGSSDPRCTFELTGVDDPWKSHTVKKCLDPKFHEQFVRLLDVPGDGSSPSLTVICEDVDEVSGADFMGAAPRLPSSLRVDGVPSSNPPHAIAATQANSPWTSLPSRTTNRSGNGTSSRKPRVAKATSPATLNCFCNGFIIQ